MIEQEAKTGAPHGDSRGLMAASDEGVTIDFEGRCYEVRHGETVFEALLRGGADIRYSCKKGSCHTCILQLVSGSVAEEGKARLAPEMVRQGGFLPCVSCPTSGKLEVKKWDFRRVVTETLVAEKTQLALGVTSLKLEPPNHFSWFPGQHVMLTSESGEVRPFSIVSNLRDYFVELHIRHVPGGAVSEWIQTQVHPGSGVKIQGPLGSVYYREEHAECPLLLVGTGTGAGMLVGIARAALAAGHEKAVRVVVSASCQEQLYVLPQLEELARTHENFTFVPVIEEREQGAIGAPLLDAAFAGPVDPSCQLFLCGNPEVVALARVRALTVGLALGSIHADPFTPAHHKTTPRDKQKLAGVAPDPELWTALGEGHLLREILTEFYQRVYEDPKLAPFFHRVTMVRAIDKQYEFLRDVFSGTKDYFGAKPFNAHHWMVISDELFDYRETLFFGVVEKFGVDAKYLLRWRALHELFRAEIVKSQPRGLIIDNVERIHPPYTDERLEIAAVCDGCSGEVLEGSVVRLIHRTGQLFCEACTGGNTALS